MYLITRLGTRLGSRIGHRLGGNTGSLPPPPTGTGKRVPAVQYFIGGFGKVTVSYKRGNGNIGG